MNPHRSSCTRLSLLLILLVLPASIAGAQSTPSPSAKPQAFEIADIHPSPYVFLGRYFHIAPLIGDRYVLRQATPLDLVSAAYGVEQNDVTGGPPGLEFDRYDIIAKVPPGTTPADARLMLRSLLADRFKLDAKSETKPLPAFLLKLGNKGAPKLKQAANPNDSGFCRFRPPDPPPAPNTPAPPTIALNCSNTTMQQLAMQVQGMGNLNRPVVDTTDLKGGWDFDFRFSWRAGGPDSITIFEAMDKLGLKLELGTAPRQTTAIISMADAPTPNVAEIDKLLPPSPPPAFEVAVIRPSKQESKDIQWRINGNQVTFNATLLGLIGYAWGISTFTVFEKPAFSDDLVWDITAKLPASDAAPGPGGQPRIDLDQIRLMMRSLLMERFGLKVHNEDRPGTAYTLLAASPKLRKADPANRSSCNDRPAPGEKDPRVANPLLTRYIRCQNVTIAQFAQELQGYALDTIKTPVLNATNIEGRYDLTLSFSDTHTLASPQPGAGAGGSGGVPSSDPAGVPISLQDAMLKQLGLKLQLGKRPVPALVIDHLNEKPTDN